jgi:hypothetical protein
MVTCRNGGPSQLVQDSWSVVRTASVCAYQQFENASSLHKLQGYGTGTQCVGTTNNTMVLNCISKAGGTNSPHMYQCQLMWDLF